MRRIWCKLASAAQMGLLAIFLASSAVVSFNLDTEKALVHRGPTGTYFGFAVSQHRDQGTSWLLVGAPLAQTDQPLVEKGGAVYRCSTDTGGACQQIAFDRAGSTKITLRGKEEKTDEKSNQWFGATLHSSGENGMIVACAPRYVYYSTNLRRRDPVGTCWVSRSSFTNFQEYSPCRTAAWGIHRQGSCQAGFSAAVTNDGRQLYMGAVGSWYWQGQVFSQDLFSKQSLLHTLEAPEIDDDSFLGYSSAVGEFSGDNSADVVVGMPRGNNLTGKVVLLNSNLKNLYNITGKQMGSYFGYSVAVADMNGDGLDDVIIGAPLYTDLNAKDGSFEKGRVCVAYQNKKHEFRSKSWLDGTQSKGRFGLAVASLKDINRDGYQDIAVSAPYGGEGERGVVYIFHGGKNGIQQKHAQEIHARDVGDDTIRTFGFSLSGGMDLDNNEYTDLLVGAYNSDRAVFLRARPVVNVNPSMKVDPEKVLLEDKGCSLKDGSQVPCVVVSFCLEYSGIGVNPELEFQYHIQVDANKQAPRVFFLTNETRNDQITTVKLRKEARYCNSLYAYVKANVRDKLSPIVVKVTYDLVDSASSGQTLRPILNKNVPSVLTKQVNIQKECGKDNVCIPDLQIRAIPNMDQYLIGSRERLELDVSIVNQGEDAFEAMLYLSMPLDVSFININKSKHDLPISCSGAHPRVTRVNDLVCDIGNPLPANKKMHLTILLAASNIVSAAPNFIFELNVNSTNVENNNTLHDNAVTIDMPVRVEVEMTVRGISRPTTMTINITEILPEDKESEVDIGPEVTHVYEVTNRGLSVVREAEVYILWPTHTLYGKNLLYLMESPRIKGQVRCQEMPSINPLHFKKLRKTSENSGQTSTKDLKDITSLDDLISEEDEDESDDNEDESDDNEELPRRNRRAAFDDEMFQKELACGTSMCARIRCTIYNLKKGEPVLFTVNSRLWQETIQKLNMDNLQISSKMVTRVTSLPYDVDPKYLEYITFMVTTAVHAEDLGMKHQYIPLWIILLAVCGGLLLLGLLALLLWRLGFFKRKRPQEEEPLYVPEKNGYKLAKDETVL